ncbi:MAG: response regulator transcription factor [Actinobacteria bacterium]|nr:response regulator transcription factor [Actinomycetota bacterium]
MAGEDPGEETKREESKIKVLVVDDHQMVRQGLRLLMEGEADMEVAGEAVSGREMMRRVDERRWDVVLLDITLPDCCGLDLLREIKDKRPGMPVVILSMHPASDYAREALSRGAAGYVAKDAAAAEVVEAIRTVVSGGTYVSGSPPRREKRA